MPKRSARRRSPQKRSPAKRSPSRSRSRSRSSSPGGRGKPFYIKMALRTEQHLADGRPDKASKQYYMEQVYKGNKNYKRTAGGLRACDILKLEDDNGNVRYVSKRKHAQGKKLYKKYGPINKK